MPRTVAYRAHAAAAAKIEQRDADRLALEIDPSIADEIDALDEPATCTGCGAELSGEEIEADNQLCDWCFDEAERERLSDEREER